MLQKKRGKHSILSQMIKILLVQGLDVVTRIFIENRISREQWGPIVGNDAVHGEAAGQTRDASERSLERLFQVMGVVVFEYLNHGNPTGGLVIHLGLPTQCQYLLFLIHRVDHVRQTHRIHPGIGINCHEEAHHVRLQIQINHGTLDCTIKLSKFPPIVDAIVVANRDELRITLTTISRLGAGGGLGGETHLGNDDVLQKLVSLLQYPMIDPCAVLGVRHTNTIVLERVVLEVVDVKSQNVGQMLRSRHVFSISRD
mmetsp:Transcript_6062/g.10044  ORF Transcript_6062/g.10044 Transcript_6062/m.10044 type:complete len:256 (-) Transcript_6062:195-962(-)